MFSLFREYFTRLAQPLYSSLRVHCTSTLRVGGRVFRSQCCPPKACPNMLPFSSLSSLSNILANSFSSVQNRSNIYSGFLLKRQPPFSCPSAKNPSLSRSSPNLSQKARRTGSDSTSQASLIRQKWWKLVSCESLDSLGCHLNESFLQAWQISASVASQRTSRSWQQSLPIIIMNQEHLKFLNQLQAMPQNARCFQCEAVTRDWASVNNGIFLCLKCAGVHRGLGVSTSFVRSVTMDAWNQSQLLLMKAGGNQRLACFLDSYGISKTASPDYKFNTKAMTYYREMLKCQVEFRELPEAPSALEGVKKETRVNAARKEQVQAQPKEEDAYGEAKQVIAQIGTKAKQGLSSLYEVSKKKYEETNFKELAVDTKKKVAETIQGIDLKAIGDKSKQVAVSAKAMASTGLEYGKIGAQFAWSKISGALWG